MPSGPDAAARAAGHAGRDGAVTAGGAVASNELSWMNFTPLQYDEQLQLKARSVHRRFSHQLAADAAPMTIFASQPRHFRQRARFAFCRFPPEDLLSYAVYEKGSLCAVPPNFPIASQAINALMPQLLEALNASTALSNELAAVHFLSTQTGDMLVTLIYGGARGLDDSWREAAIALKEVLGLPALMGRTKGQVLALDRD